ncbi:hypothetical protein BKA69DRAFT_1037326 [Paraphysoderma sedebokerense]|nr:hypothetical protein BKA69DRAFT_1037311 [Paraphysoderma sedebokerense]KAI9142891.1 hypothetical protein BKA69DRAFT_1037326 [Paraphysoderma sedebokerense]
MTKLHRHPANAVIIPPYTVSDPSIRAEDDTALLSLLRYLRFAADHINVPAPSDVRDFLRSSPFSVTFNFDTSTSYSSSSATYGRSDDEDSSSSVGSSLPDSSTTAFSSSSNVTSLSLLQTPLDRAMCGYGGSKTTYLSTENQNRIRYSLSDEWKDYDDLDLTKSIELRNEREQKKAEMRAQEEKDRIERKIKKAREKKIRKRERKRLAISVTRELLANAQGTLVDVNETTEKASDSLQKHLEEECARQC